MADTQTADIRALLGGGSSEDRLAATHFLVGAGFAAIGGALQLLGLFALRFSGLFPVSYGLIQPAANLTLIVGFATISLVGGVYYVLPRLTGTGLEGTRIAGLGLLGMAGLTGLGVIAVLFGLGDGSQPLGIPWWLDLPLAAVLFAPALVTVATIRNREEEHGFVTLWFVLGAVVWLPLLYVVHLATELPGVSAVTSAFAEVFLSAGFVTMFLVTAGSGLIYYSVVKELDVALASRQLAMVGFWSLGFAGVWWGAAQLLFGPGPGWLAGVAAALGLAYPIGALANAANVSLTLEGSWARLGERPAVLSGLIGLYLAVGVALIASLAGFRSIGSVTSLTAFWEAVEYVSLSGLAVFLVSGVSFGALPRLVGRRLENPSRVRRFQRLTLAGSVGIILSLGGAGVVQGYGWIAGSNSGSYIDAGEGWGTAWGGPHDALVLIALLFGIALFLGLLGYVGIVFGTVTRGKAIPQEILVAREPEGE